MSEYKCPVCRSPCRAEAGNTMVCTSCEFRFSISDSSAAISQAQSAAVMVSNPTQAGVDLEIPISLVEIDGYKILGRLGKGGMGEVYKAEQIGLGRLVAIKVLSPELSQNPHLIQRFEREANALAQLQHASIVWIINKGKTLDGRVFFAMEYIEGDSLRVTITEGRYTLEQRIEIVLGVGETLAYTHLKNIVHRDIKPENIMIVEDRNRVLVKILDFGLAGAVNRAEQNTNLTREGMGLGTPLYMSPEQRINPRDVDARADIYSVGVVFYELLTGNIPVGRYRAPHLVNPDVPAAFAEIIDRMLEPDRDYRYQKMEEAVEAVRSVLKRTAVDPHASIPAVSQPIIATSSYTTQDKRARIEGQATPGHRVVLQVNDRSYPTDVGPDGRFQAEVDLRDGKNVVVSRAIHNGTESPLTTALEILSLPSRPALNDTPSECLDPRLTLRGVAAPGALVRVDVGGREYQIPADNRGAFLVEVELEEGSNAIKAWAEVDGLRSTEAARAEVVLPLSPPRITELPASVRASSLMVRGRSCPGSRVEVHLGERVFRTSTDKQGGFETEVDLALGRNVLQARASRGEIASAFGDACIVTRRLPLDLWQVVAAAALVGMGVFGALWSMRPRIELEPFVASRTVTLRGKGPANASMHLIVNDTVNETDADRSGRFVKSIHLNYGRNTLKLRALVSGREKASSEAQVVILPPPSPIRVVGIAHQDLTALVRGRVGPGVEVTASQGGRVTKLTVSDAPGAGDLHEFEGRIRVSAGENEIRLVALADGIESEAYVLKLLAPPEPPEIVETRPDPDAARVMVFGIEPTPGSLVQFRTQKNRFDPIEPEEDQTFKIALGVDHGENVFHYYAYLARDTERRSLEQTLKVTGPPPPPTGLIPMPSPTGEPRAVIHGTARFADRVIVRPADGSPLEVAPGDLGAFECSVDLIPGPNNIRLQSAKGDFVSQEAMVSVPSKPPPPRIFDVETLGTGSRSRIRGQSYPGTTVALWSDRGRYSARAPDGAFSLEIDLEPGENELTMTAELGDLRSEEATRILTAPPPVPADLVADVSADRELARIWARTTLIGADLLLQAEGAVTGYRLQSEDGLIFETVDPVRLEAGDNRFLVWAVYKGLESERASLIVAGVGLPIPAPADVSLAAAGPTSGVLEATVVADSRLLVEVGGRTIEVDPDAAGRARTGLDLGFGVHRVRVYTKQSLGRSSSVAAELVLAPPVPDAVTSVLSGDGRQILVSGACAGGAPVRILQGERILSEVACGESGVFRAELESSYGAHRYDVVAVVGEARSEPATVAIDVPPPSPRNLTFEPGDTGEGLLQGSAEPGTTVVVSLGEVEYPVQAAHSGRFQLALRNLPVGRHGYQARTRVDTVLSDASEGGFDVLPAPPHITRHELGEEDLSLEGEVMAGAELVLIVDGRGETRPTTDGRFALVVPIREKGTEVSLVTRVGDVESTPSNLGKVQPRSVIVPPPLVLTKVPSRVYRERIDVQGTTVPETLVRIDLNGEVTEVKPDAAGAFAARLVLRDGMNQLSMVAASTVKDRQSLPTETIRIERIVTLNAPVLEPVEAAVEEPGLKLAGSGGIAGARVEVKVNGKIQDPGSVDAQGRFAVELELAPGVNALELALVLEDARSPALAREITYIDVLSPPSVDGVPQRTESTRISLSGRAPRGATVHARIGSGGELRDVAASGRFRINGLALKVGRNEITVHATRSGKRSEPVVVTLVCQPPSIEPPRFDPPLKQRHEGLTMTLAGRTTAGARVFARVNGARPVSFPAPKGRFEGQVALVAGNNQLVFWSARNEETSDSIEVQILAVEERRPVASPPPTRVIRPPRPEPSRPPPVVKPPPPAMGQVTVSTTPPGAEIFLDGKSTGKSTPANLVLAPGSYFLELKKPLHIPTKQTVQIRAGASQAINVKLEVWLFDVPPGDPAKAGDEGFEDLLRGGRGF